MKLLLDNILNNEESKITKDSNFKIVHGDVNIGIFGKDFNVLFSKQEGGIVSLRYSNKEFITIVPKPYYFRATTDNDRGNKLEFRCENWLAASIGQKYVNLEMEGEENKISLTYTYELPTNPSTNVNINYTVEEDGVIKVSIKYNGKKVLPELPVLGMKFRLLIEFNSFVYYGMGPEENYIFQI